MPLGDDVQLGDVAQRTAGYTGADLAAVCREAAMQALRDADDGVPRARAILARHFDAALAQIAPSLSAVQLARYADKLA